ncbi:MAG: hypothetical protein J3Q66DRAFT_375077 [Benniella sp.]|nr:MAG: hypothetical protein J3Q66DRAFT_375077 [Benniella sp.]
MHLAYSLFLLFSAIVVLGQEVVQRDVAAFSFRALFSGVDSSDPKAPINEIIKGPKNHATATASILEYFSRQKNFHPKQHGLYKTKDEFKNFTLAIRSFRPFALKHEGIVRVSVEHGLNHLKDDIAKVYVPPSGKADVAASAFVAQVPRSTDRTLGGPWRIVLITIHGGESNKIILDISSLALMVSVSRLGKVSLIEQGAFINQTTYELDTRTLVEDSLKFVKELSVVNVTTFTDIFSTPKPKSTKSLLDTSLFESDHACKEESILSKYAHCRQTLYPLSQLRMD